MPSLFPQFLFLFVALPVSPAFASNAAPLPHGPLRAPEVKIGSLHFVGQLRLTEAQVIAASGLKVGQLFDPKKLDAVTEKLGKSGVFQEVSYRYQPEAGQMAVEFKVKEAARFHRCTFDNFVWISDDDLQEHLKKTVPLYSGVVPESGDILDDMAHSLQSLLQEKGITAQVTHIQEGALGDQNWVHLFSADGPAVKVQTVNFTGALPENLKQLQRQAAPLLGRNYSRLQCALYSTNTFLPYYRERGYLRADVGSSTARVLNHPGATNEFSVEVIYPVNEGAVYKWTPADWSGSQLLAPQELEGLMGFKPNELASGKKIDDGWDTIRKAYSKKGYLEAAVKPETLFDEPGLHVQYRVAISDGPQYHMGNFLIAGVSPDAAERLKKKWRLKPGEVFDASYFDDFSRKELLPALQGAANRNSKLLFTALPDRQHHVVDVTFRLQ